VIIIVMGVAGAGKTTVGTALSRRLGWPFIDGDDYHPAANIHKMSRGEPLTDEDRRGWLTSLRQMIDEHVERGESVVLACSALKAAYRNQLGQGVPSVAFVYLRGDIAAIRVRLKRRGHHFMKAGMLASQFQDLEEPDDAVVVNATEPPDRIVEAIITRLALPRPRHTRQA
jgi:gluconokinase